jgi:hypothetical protein
MKQIMINDEDSATYKTNIKGWVSSTGRFFGENEDAARYDGCTHRPCVQCGKPTKKHYYKCEYCRRKEELDRYYAMPKKQWDGEAVLYSDAYDEYYPDIHNVINAAEDYGITLSELRIVICEPVYPKPLTSSYFEDEMVEDDELPYELIEALEQFNDAVKNVLISWEPGHFALDVEGL